MYKKKLLQIVLLWLPFITVSQTNIKKTEVLILGTPHLFEIENFNPSMLSAVKEKLNTYEFDVVCVEKMPGQLLYDISKREDTFFNGLKRMQAHIKLADSVQSEIGGTFLTSERKISEILLKEQLTDEDRKDLLYHYIATTNIPSAALQFLYLKQKPNVFTTELDTYLKAYIKKVVASSNEYFSLAAPLAFENKLNKIEPIDNMQDMALLTKYYPSFMQDFNDNPEIIEKVMNAAVLKKSEALKQEAVKNNDLSKLYSFVNSKEYMENDFIAQWQIWLETNFASNSDRARYSLWEMRNLQISANILNVVARHPKEKILVIIGSSHKSFLEKYLRQIVDIKLLTY